MDNKIISAFLSLLQNKSFSSITVNQIAKEVGIPRTAFYTYYDSKEELAQSILMDIMLNTFNLISKKFNNRENDDQITSEWLLNLAHHRHAIRKLWIIKNRHINLRQSMKKQISLKAKQSALNKWPMTDEKRASFFGDIFADCALETMNWYLKDDNKPTTAEFVDYINTCCYEGIVNLVRTNNSLH